MYRIARIAELLEVSTIQIHEKLITYRDELKGLVVKEHGVTYLDEKGLLFLKSVFDQENKSLREVVVEDIEKNYTKTLEDEEKTLTDIEKREVYLLELRENVIKSKSELYKLDMDSKKLDEAINHYQNIIESTLESGKPHDVYVDTVDKS